MALLVRYLSPQRINNARCGHVRQLLKKHAPRLAERLVEEDFAALAE